MQSLIEILQYENFETLKILSNFIFRDPSRGALKVDFYVILITYTLERMTCMPLAKDVFIKVRENEHPEKYVPENCSCK